MYFPYLRGRQSELTALTSVAPDIASNKRVIPIIEPIDRDTNQLLKALKPYNFYKIPYVLIVNPQVGEVKDYPVHISSQIDSGKIRLEGEASLGYLIHPSTRLQDVRAFSKKYNEYRLSFIHDHSLKDVDKLVDLMKSCKNVSHQIFLDGRTEFSYQESFTDYNRVLIYDGFNKAATNAEFPPDELFSDLHLRYKKLGFYGFGDFTITGKKYIKGGIPYAVAIHLTYYNSLREALRIRHFISDRTKTRDDPGGKFLEALVKLIEFLNENPHVETGACKEFRALYTQERFPGLPEIKYLSIKHHLQLLLGLMKKK
jgi:hypothetical protein